MSEARWLDTGSTARYISVRVDALSRLVRAGKIPAANYTLGCRSPRWDKIALDAQFGSGVDSDGANPVPIDWNEVSRINAEKIREEGRRKAGRSGRPLRDEGRD